MPYIIVAGMIPGPAPRTMARIFEARPLQSNTTQEIYAPAADSLVAAVVFTPADEATGELAHTYSVDPGPGRALAGLGTGPYADLGEIRNAVEAYTDETCRIIVSDGYEIHRRQHSVHDGELASKGEISFDLVMTDDMPFVEGAYRQEGGAWKVFTFRHPRETEAPCVRHDVIWPSGVMGINVVVAGDIELDKAVILKVMTDALGISEWTEIRGPDSMQLR